MKLLKSKSAFFLCAVLALFYFTNDFALIDIEKTAIVVAIGVDKSGEEYEVTAQIALPQATDTASSNDDAVLTAKGRTVFEAIENVASKSGWHAKLSFCGLLIIGREVAEESAADLIDYIISSEKFENSTLAVVSDTTAKEILLATTPLDAISSFALQKIVLKNEWMLAPVSVTNVKRFAVASYSPSRAAYLPLIKIIKGDNKGKVNSSSSAVTASAGGGESGESGSGESGDKTVIFDASSSALFKDGKLVATIGSEESKILNMLSSPVRESYLTAEKDGVIYYFKMTCKDRAVKTFVENRPKVEYILDVTVRVTDATRSEPLDSPDNRFVLSEDLLAALREKIERSVSSLDATVCDTDCDVLGVKDKMYKFHNGEYKKIKDLPLKEYSRSVKVSVSSED